MSFTSLMSLVLLLVMAQLFGQLSNIAESNADMITVAKFLAYSVPKMINLVLPFSLCLGILATQAAFARNSEIIAMQACSVSLLKIYTPFLVAAIVTTALMGATSFYLYPLGQKEADRIENLTLRRGDVTGSFTLTGSRFKVGNDFYRVDTLDVTRGVMKHVTCYRIVSGRLSEIITADSASWDGNRWDATSLEALRLDSRGITGPLADKHLPLVQKPEDLVLAQTNTEVLTLWDLSEYIDQLRDSGTSSPTAETMYYSRISFALAPLVITLLVIPFGLRFPRAGGIAKGITLGLVVGLFYWGLHSGISGLGASGVLPPLLSAWGANIMAFVISFIILFKKRRAVYG
jgi:lipopolysaccharide export system permease protein